MDESQWHDEGNRSWRIRRRFAIIPRRTFDCGWRWLCCLYWWECVWGWGFHDRWPYRHHDNIQLAGLP